MLGVHVFIFSVGRGWMIEFSKDGDDMIVVREKGGHFGGDSVEIIVFSVLLTFDVSERGPIVVCSQVHFHF